MNEDRQKLWDEYTGDKTHLGWSWLRYTRYRKAVPLLENLQKRGEDITTLHVYDYGCGVGDYGFVFGRAGANVTFYDFERQINFVKYRVEKEPIKAAFVFVGDELYIENPAFVIFGEVLEHVTNPPEILQKLLDGHVRYIYTSSYPYRSDDPNDDYWHKGGHGNDGLPQMQKPCRELLESHYTFTKFDGEARLWTLK